MNMNQLKVGKTTGNRVALTIEERNRLEEYYRMKFIKPSHKMALGYFL